MRHFWRCYGRVLKRQDCVGCAIAYCTFHFLPRNVRLDQAIAGGIGQQVFMEFLRFAPGMLADGGFLPRVGYPPRLLPLAAWELYRAWAAVYDPANRKREPEQTERERVLYALRVVEIFRADKWMPTREQESRVFLRAAKSAKLGDVDADDVRNELWGRMPAAALYRRKNGTIGYNVDRLRDALRILAPPKAVGLDGLGEIPAVVAAPDDSEIVRRVELVRAIVQNGRARGLAMDALLFQQETNCSREEAGKKYGVTGEAVRYAEDWFRQEAARKTA